MVKRHTEMEFNYIYENDPDLNVIEKIDKGTS